MTNKVKCPDGYHNYTIPNENDLDVLICDVCKRVGYRKCPDGLGEWFEYDEKGNIIHFKNSDGYEIWFDEKGNMIHCKDSDGFEMWFNEKGSITRCKDSNGPETRFDEKGNIIKQRI